MSKEGSPTSFQEEQTQYLRNAVEGMASGALIVDNKGEIKPIARHSSIGPLTPGELLRLPGSLVDNDLAKVLEKEM